MPSASSTATRSARLPARTSMRVPAVSPSVCMPRNSRFARRDSTAPFSSWRPRRLRPASEDELIEHCQSVARELPVIGFYLHAAVGGMALSRSFWTRFAGIDNVIAIKVAPFDRYKTLDVAFGVVAAAAEDRLTLYTGNDDHIIADLVTPMRIGTPGREVVLRFNPRCTGQGTHAPVRAGSAMAQSVTTTTRGKLTMKIDDDTWNAIVARPRAALPTGMTGPPRRADPESSRCARRRATVTSSSSPFITTTAVARDVVTGRLHKATKTKAGIKISPAPKGWTKLEGKRAETIVSGLKLTDFIMFLGGSEAEAVAP